jgi:hypothetical protein
MTANATQDQYLNIIVPRQFTVKDSDFHQFINIKAILKNTLRVEVSYKEHDELDNGKYVATFTVTNWGLINVSELDTMRTLTPTPK